MTYAKGMLAGFIATVVLSLVMLGKGAVGLMPQLDVIAALTALLGSESRAVGWIAHFVLGTVPWGIAFVLIERGLPGGCAMRGVLFGGLAWVAMMVIFMPLIGAGLFANQLGWAVWAVTLVLHVIYGWVLGFTYGRLTGTVGDYPPAREEPARR
ncbi:hypothetical protein C882_3774 [Caenispirillum salinarum AK4]|uniref:Transmembrane protein n=1 Tax=Caenispirillum salinarum AK4 TaxID=1238182 RepID=K9HSV0_9PROT|nr:DUF6789 family protein [Caenispirillum salinarum]EKV31401.1 hypothetical protein C882_3774 [Caenispirillum salinarum AK4]